MKGDKPMTAQTSLKNLLQKPGLLVSTPRAFPATAQASKDTPKRKGSQLRRSIQGHPRKKVKRGKREGKKERGRERERREKKKAGAPSYEQSSRDAPKKERGNPEYSIQENPKKQGKKRGG